MQALASVGGLAVLPLLLVLEVRERARVLWPLLRQGLAWDQGSLEEERMLQLAPGVFLGQGGRAGQADLAGYHVLRAVRLEPGEVERQPA